MFSIIINQRIFFVLAVKIISWRQTLDVTLSQMKEKLTGWEAEINPIAQQISDYFPWICFLKNQLARKILRFQIHYLFSSRFKLNISHFLIGIFALFLAAQHVDLWVAKVLSAQKKISRDRLSSNYSQSW